MTLGSKPRPLRNETDAGAEYAMALLRILAGLPGDPVDGLISYGAREVVPASPSVHIVRSDFFQPETYASAHSQPSLPLRQVEGVPLLYGSPRIERQGDGLVVQADIVASAYYLVTRYEEIVRPDVRDKHGRFPGRQSLPYRAGFLHRPVVNEYAALLRNWLREVGVDVPEPRRRFSLLLTHDVDSVRKYYRWWQPLRTTTSALLGRQPLSGIPESVGCVLGSRPDPFDTFGEIISLDATPSLPCESAYFLMGGGRTALDGAYSIHDTAVRELVATLRDSGVIVGLHPSYEAGLQPERISEEKAALEQACGFPIRHSRHHFLAWREIEDGWHLARAGIDWDSTLGYADVAGFRLGVCQPIPLFDPVSLRPMGIEEHPLLVMDCTLDRSHYMGLSEEDAFACCRQLMDQTRKHRGEFVMLWHNTSFAPAQGNYHPRLYRRLLRHVAGEGVSPDGVQRSRSETCES